VDCFQFGYISIIENNSDGVILESIYDESTELKNEILVTMNGMRFKKAEFVQQYDEEVISKKQSNKRLLIRMLLDV
jgi:hypothetical protein